ncbi:MAG: triose-phosphate isomerase [Patescibacteria group bacterium]
MVETLWKRYSKNSNHLKTFIEPDNKQDLVRIKIFAQNINSDNNGSPLVGPHSAAESYFEIARVGASGSILGHSELRARSGETDLDVRSKFLGMTLSGLVPLVCVGETLNIRYPGDKDGPENRIAANEFVTKQIKDIFGDLDPEIVRGTVVAYEPRWAIGTDKSATPEQIKEAHDAIKNAFAELYGKDIAKTVRVLYGGSANPKNVKEIFSIRNVDGFLVGSASASENGKDFYKMGKIMQEMMNEKLLESKGNRLPILAGNLKLLRRDLLPEEIVDDYQQLNDLDRKKLQIILSPPNTLIQEFANAF